MKTHQHWFHKTFVTIFILAISFVAMVPATSHSQDPEDELGNWLIYNGTVRFSDQWSLFTEAQIRLWDVVSDLNEVFVRAAGHYDLPNSPAMVGLGYMRSDTWPYGDGSREVIENRIYQQFGIHQTWARSLFDHRYRLEERWRDRGEKTDFSIRVRYRLQVTTPLNRETMEPGAHFLNFYDEIFITFDDPRVFDQNRLYGAWGYQFTRMANLQLGLLWQARPTGDFFRLQIFYTHNFDLRDG